MNCHGIVLTNELRHWPIKDVIEFGAWAVVNVLESLTPYKLQLTIKQKTKLITGLKKLTILSHFDVKVLRNYALDIYHEKASTVGDAAYYIIDIYADYLDELAMEAEDRDGPCDELYMINSVGDNIADLIEEELISLSGADLLSNHLSDILLGKNESDIPLSKGGNQHEEEPTKQGVLNKDCVAGSGDSKSKVAKTAPKKRRRQKSNR